MRSSRDFFCVSRKVSGAQSSASHSRGHQMADPDHDDPRQPMHRKKPPWVATLVAQAALCLALYAAFNLANTSNHGENRGSRDLYFLSVRGGLRSLREQTQLLQQMDNAARALKIKFVVNLSEHGEKDPLLGNATLYFPSLKIPWYATRVSRGSEVAHFKEQITVRQGQTIDIIGVDTWPWQDFVDVEQVNGSKSKQYSWLTRTLAGTSGTWRIVVGFHPLIDCKEGVVTGKVKPYDQLHHIFLQHGVSAYLSKEGCTGFYIEHEGISYIGIPGSADEEFKDSLADRNLNVNREMHNGFLLHRISPLEIETYFINSAGDVILQQTIHQWGKQSM